MNKLRVALLATAVVALGGIAFVARSGDAPFCSAPTRPPLTPIDASVRTAVLDGTPEAVDAAVADDGTLYVARRSGSLDRIDRAGARTTILDLTDATTTDGERGLLSIALVPNERALAVGYTDLRGDLRIAMADIDPPETQRAADLIHVMTVLQNGSGHNGGNVRYGPDGVLYVGTGEGGLSDLVADAPQDLRSLNGKLLRIRPTPDGPVGYEIPEGNPFVDRESARPEIWASGLRNPWRVSFDPDSGDLWVGDVGGSCVEEVNVLPSGRDGLSGAGANLGWPMFEGTERRRDPSDASLVQPVLTYPHQQPYGCSVTGGVLYRGQALPELEGLYVFGDLCLKTLFVFDPDRETLHDLGVSVDMVASIVTDQDGEVLVVSLTAGVSRLEPR